ncbi:MAG: response regulator [Lachnospiraceae bacterium]|nr:response regulator [Lachnospiraceae bacterium]
MKKRILIILAAIILNVAGRYIAFSNEWPMYFNLCGTIFASYLAGPVAGVISAVLSCAFSLIFSISDWYYLIADVFVAVAAGLIAKRNRYFDKFMLIYSATAFFTVVRAPVLMVVNLSINEGKSGFYIVDAIYDYLDSISSPMWLGNVLTAIFVSFTDVLCAMLLIYFIMRIHRNFGKKKKASEMKKELMKKVSLGLIGIAFFVSVLGNTSVYAENSISFIEKLYNSDNGLVGGCLNDIAMTRDGSMWIATYGGLFRFNGSKFVLIDNLSSVRSVQTLFVDEEDRLWAGTQDAGFTLLNIDMSWVTHDMNTGLPSNSVKCISRDSNGYYYFGTTGGLVYGEYDNGDVNILKVDTEAGNIRDLSPDGEGHMIVMDNLGHISCYENGELKNKADLGEYSAKGIRLDPHGLIYIGTNSEMILIYEYDNDHGFRCLRALTAEGMKTIRDFYFDDNDIIFVAADNGIGYFDGSNHFSFIETGVFNNSIDHIYKDYQGNIWFTSARCGLLCLGKSSFIDVFKLCNEKNIVCNAIKNWNGFLYVGSNDGLKILDVEEGESIKNDITDWFKGIRIRCLDTDMSGNLLAATYDRGLIQISKDGDISEYVSTEETQKMIRVVHTLSDGTVISSSDAGMVFMKDHKVMAKLDLGKELNGGTILNILEMPEGTLLCGSDGDGVAVIKDNKLVRYITREDGIPSGVILRVVADKYTDGYFILTGSGLCYMDKEFRIKEIGMPYYNNFDMAVNSDGEIFVLGGAGIYISEYDALMENGRMDNYVLLDTKAGLPGSITSNAWNYMTDDEYIYICGTSGVYMLDLNNYEMNIEEFKTKITAVTLDGVYQDVTEVGTIFIPKDTERIELNLEINNYTTADPYVSYYLSGVDSEKNTVLSSKLGGVTYYDIPYGNHDFVISVLDEKGMELSKQTYVFSKERELFETIGFVLYFYLVLFTFLVFIVISIVQGALWSQRKKESGRHELVITQLEREKAEALERALHMEEDANRTKSEFLANMSHEIITPINAIIGMDTMIMRESGEETIKNYARDIDVAGNTLLALINDILDFSKIESGRLELTPGEYELSNLINGVVNMVKPNAESKKLRFEVNVNPEIPNRLYGDVVRLEQVIINILNNAIKYTEKGMVSFNVDFEAEDAEYIILKVSVQDTGIGIKPEDLEKLYSPYERIDERRKSNGDGKGLGLSITKSLLDRMGSELKVSSVYGEGSTFGFEILQSVRNNEKIGDYRDREGEKHKIVIENERFHAPDAKILVIDDVEMNLVVIRKLLKRIKAGIDTAQSGAEALKLAKNNKYDIILLESMLQGMNGEDTMKRIRTECPDNAETPMIVITSNAMKGSREEFLNLGYTNYLAKPVDGMKLEAMIQSYLPDEKIKFTDEEDIEDTADPEITTKLSLISQIDGIDTVQGAETAGGDDTYVLLCKNFHDLAKKRISVIKEALDKKDYETYTIQLHDLTNAARLIGAFELSKKAEILENAGREENADRIKADTEKVLKEYKRLYDGLDKVFN